MDFGKAFTFAFEDEEWIKKLAIAGLIFFVSILLIIPGMLFIAGYPLTVGRNVLNGSKRPLPTTDEMGTVFKDGLYGLLIGLIYSAPVILVSLPFGIIIGLASEGGDAAAAFAAVVSILFSCLLIILSLLLAVFLPGVMTQYILTDDFGACFRFTEIWSKIVRPNLANIVLLILATIAAQLIIQLVLGVSIITICGPLLLAWPAAVWAAALQGHLYGQLAALTAGAGPTKEETAALA